MTDANSGEIQAVEVTTCQYGDAEMLQPLLDQIDEPIASVTADGAYDTVNCYDAILKRRKCNYPSSFQCCFMGRK